jgi:hypothetical protein
MMHPEGLEFLNTGGYCAGVPLRYASDRHSAWWVTSLTISAVTAADGDQAFSAKARSWISCLAIEKSPRYACPSAFCRRYF